MPCRIIRDGFLSSDRINMLSEADQNFFIRLCLIVDDFGRFDGRTSVIRSAAYPISEKQLSDIAKSGDNLIRAGLLYRYIVNHKPYIEIPRFDQRLRQRKERYPGMPENTNVGQLSDNCPTRSYIFFSDSYSDSDSDSTSDSIQANLPAIAGQLTCNRQTIDGQLTDKLRSIDNKRCDEEVTEKKPIDKSTVQWRLAEIMVEDIQEWNKSFKTPSPAKLSSWAETFEKIHRIDNRGWHWINNLLGLIKNDWNEDAPGGFKGWRNFILSPGKLRENINSGKLDALIAKIPMDKLDPDETVEQQVKEKYAAKVENKKPKIESEQVI